jgi:predicted RNA-binding Zn ribbon-like protein
MLAGARLGLDAAPGGLLLVQDLVNTSLIDPAMGLPDLLLDVDDAQAWLDAVLATWHDGASPPAVTLTDGDLPRLRALREAVRALLLGGEVTPVPSQIVELELRDGVVGYRAPAGGWRAVAALVHVELLLAQHTGALERFRSCANPACGAAFYDRTRNGSRVWHDAKTCGNVMNLRASRARRAGR